MTRHMMAKIGGALMIAAMGIAPFAYAQSDAPVNAAGAMSLSVSRNGHTTLVGTNLTATAGLRAPAQLQVQSWGGVWNVNITSDTKFEKRGGGRTDLAGILNGDTLVVTGTASTQDKTITATNVRANTFFRTSLRGTVKDIDKDAHTFTLQTPSGATVVVHVDDNTKFTRIANKDFDDLAVGMKVNVNGDMHASVSPSNVIAVNVLNRGPIPKPVVRADLSIESQSFIPSTITLPVGAIVTWHNNDDVDHTVTADNGSFDSGALSHGDKFTHTFATAGTFPYHCSFHSDMQGVVVVQ